MLTCVVSENRANHTVIWKKSDEILTAGMVRVTSDTRISVLHDESEWKKGIYTKTKGLSIKYYTYL